MGHKHKISLSLSFLLGLIFSLPWLTLVEHVRLTNIGLANPPVSGRVVFIFLTVFTSSVVLFSYNFFWRKILLTRSIKYRSLLNIILILLVICILTIFIEGLAILIFEIKALKAYFLIYFFRNLIIAVVVFLVTYAVDLVEKLRQERIEVLLLQNQNAETELAALRSQIDPHFLFNTLTTLSSLARGNNAETVSFIDHMADVFRYMLENRSQKVVLVGDELSFLRSYLFMMKKRFEAGLHVEIDIGRSQLEMRIPQFALQVVIENAIKHNIVSVKNPLRIQIRSTDDCIVVRNNLNERRSSEGFGIGLDNLSQRYWLTGNKKIRVTKGDNFFEVVLPLL